MNFLVAGLPPILNVAQCVGNGNFQLAAFHHADYFEGSGLLIWWFKFCSWFMTLFPLWKNDSLIAAPQGLGSLVLELQQPCVWASSEETDVTFFFTSIFKCHITRTRTSWCMVRFESLRGFMWWQLGPQYGDIERYGSAMWWSLIQGY